ncbi:MAG: CHC2 zinc finger domain-containing protein [Actinomycetota bacterium]|nr:CHC2 zinc finger domain-containing protein [Actinomycetota bacterium]
MPIVELAERLSGPGVRRGKEIYFVCPLHDDHDPSLRVDPVKNLWYCDPCAVGGDVVELAQRAWNIERADVAAAEVLMTFGHEVPERPPAWFARQDRQAPVRNRLHREKVEHIRMLVFRLIWVPWLRTLPESVREEAAASAWRDSLWISERLYAGRGA